jgi:hypothetical protein
MELGHRNQIMEPGVRQLMTHYFDHEDEARRIFQRTLDTTPADVPGAASLPADRGVRATVALAEDAPQRRGAARAG